MSEENIKKTKDITLNKKLIYVIIALAIACAILGFFIGKTIISQKGQPYYPLPELVCSIK